jgi:DNA-directed RNA polymerase specialized sigma24 family protein
VQVCLGGGSTIVGENLDLKALADAWAVVHKRTANRNRKRGRSNAQAEDALQDTIVAVLEYAKTHEIRNPLHFLGHRFAWMRSDIARRERKTTPIGDGATWTNPETGESGDVGGFSDQVRAALTSTVDPAALAERRDLIQKIDPDWKKHLNDCVGDIWGNMLPWVVKRRIMAAYKRLMSTEGRS